MRSSVVAAWLAAFIVTGCIARTDALLGTLPRNVGGTAFTQVQVVDESFLSGHPIDDVLQRLGKTRKDAAVVYVYSADGSGTLGAATVSGVSGQELLDAVVDTWTAPSVTDRAEVAIGERTAWQLASRTGTVTIVYAAGEVVYFASSNEANRAERFAAALP